MRNFAVSIVYDQDPNICNQLQKSIVDLLRSRRLSTDKDNPIRTTVSKISIRQLNDVLMHDTPWPTPGFKYAEFRLLLASDTESTDFVIMINDEITRLAQQNPQFQVLTFDDAVRFVCVMTGYDQLTLMDTDQTIDTELEERLSDSEIEIIRSPDGGSTEIAVYAKATFIILRNYAKLQE